MNLTFRNPGFDHSIDSILLFQTDDQTPYWSDTLLYFYPQIDKAELAKRDLAGRRQYIYDRLSGVYHTELKRELDQKVADYTAHFARHKEQIEDALSEAFDMDTRSVFNDLVGNITLNPVGPRFLKERSFDIFYKSSERGALGMSLHEIIHFLWFDVWHRHFGDSYAEYETPSLKWSLSEMVVESIMRDPRLSSINPYFPRENGGCVYPYFQDMVIEDRPILDTLDALYRANSMPDFMKLSYAYCLRHEAAIRAHIEKAEQAF
jgi:hypothetical protein